MEEKITASLYRPILYAFAYGSTLMLVLYFTQARDWNIVDAIKIVGYSYGIGAFGYIAAAIVGEFS